MFVATKEQKRALAVATAAAAFFGIYFLKNYLLLIALAIIVAIIFNPIYKWLLKRGQRPGTASSYTLLIAFLAVIIPLAIVVTLTVIQVAAVADNIKNLAGNVNFNTIIQQFVDYVNRLLTSMGITYTLTVSTVTNALIDAVQNFGSNLLNGLRSSLGGVISFFTTAIIFIYVFLSILMNQDKLMETGKVLNPLGPKVSTLYTSRMAAMTKAMVRGQFIIAILQGFTDALLLYAAGIHEGFFFFFLILTALSVIPLGGGIIVIPVGVIMLLMGNFWQGALILIGHFLIVTNIDNILRPRLVPPEARLDPALTLLAVFSGIAFFGFLGIILGPVIMIVIVTTVQVFLEVFRNVKAIDNNKNSKQGRRFINKLAFWNK